MRGLVPAAAALAALGAGVVLYHIYGPRATADAQPPLLRLDTGLKPFTGLFDRDLHLTRVVLMLSPT